MEENKSLNMESEKERENCCENTYEKYSLVERN